MHIPSVPQCGFHLSANEERTIIQIYARLLHNDLMFCSAAIAFYHPRFWRFYDRYWQIPHEKTDHPATTTWNRATPVLPFPYPEILIPLFFSYCYIIASLSIDPWLLASFHREFVASNCSIIIYAYVWFHLSFTLIVPPSPNLPFSTFPIWYYTGTLILEKPCSV